MSFKDMAAADNVNVFLNVDEFAERRTVIYEGVHYENISMVLSGLKEKDRRALVHDHAQGLYQVTSTLRCDVSDLGGHTPQKGRRIKISDEKGEYFYEFYVASSVCEVGMLRVELEAMDD